MIMKNLNEMNKMNVIKHGQRRLMWMNVLYRMITARIEINRNIIKQPDMQTGCDEDFI